MIASPNDSKVWRATTDKIENFHPGIIIAFQMNLNRLIYERSSYDHFNDYFYDNLQLMFHCNFKWIFDWFSPLITQWNNENCYINGNLFLFGKNESYNIVDDLSSSSKWIFEPLTSLVRNGNNENCWINVIHFYLVFISGCKL